MKHLNPVSPVLVVDDEDLTRQSVRASLLMDGITNVKECVNGQEALSRMASKPYTAVILDLAMPGISGEELLGLLVQEQPETPVIVVTATNTIETAVRCMRSGAFDYLTKPVDRTRLLTSLAHAIEKRETTRELTFLRNGFLSTTIELPEAFQDIVTSNRQMLQIFRYVEAIAPTALPVLVTGETGVGKELMARAIHAVSGKKGNFISVNVAGLDDTLFADTLFGHVKGAYTGADSHREGVVAKAEDGTLFMDEIGDLAPTSQIKILRLLQEREYYVLGRDTPQSTRARFIFASNVDLSSGANNGAIRKDLLYRLQSHTIRVPPLRDRMEDLPVLVEHFFDKACKTLNKKRPAIPKELFILFRSYTFPGNIRELEGMIFDAVVRHKSRTLSLESFRQAMGSPEGNGQYTVQDTGNCTDPFEAIETLPTLKQADALLIAESLRRSGGNQDAAARMIGLSRSALNKRLTRQG